jgi:hypothetical protein
VALAAAVGMAADRWQAEVLRTDHPRVLLNCCRQSGKSTTSAPKAVRVAVYGPGSPILLLSSALRQSQELLEKAVAMYRLLGRPVAAEAENALSLTLENRSWLMSLPGTEAAVRDSSAARLLVVNEAARVPDDFLAWVRPMLAVSGGQLAAVCVRRGIGL